jgi:nucleotide-binding universal stress UspA family protein
MSLTTIVSYDGTAGDRDALGLARVFGELGASTILAYVSHANADRDTAQARLEAGAGELTGASTRVVVNASTSEGLKALAAAENADLFVFGSEYRTPAGRVGFQKTTQQLLENGRTAIAIAPAGYTYRGIKHIGLIAGLDDHAAIDTAHAIATHFGATVTDKVHGVDLLIVGSRPEAAEGKVLLAARNEITIEEEARTPVLVTARGVALDFRTPLHVA